MNFNAQTLIIHNDEDVIHESKPSISVQNHLNYPAHSQEKSSNQNSNFQNYLNLMKSADDLYYLKEKNDLISQIRKFLKLRKY